MVPARYLGRAPDDRPRSLPEASKTGRSTSESRGVDPLEPSMRMSSSLRVSIPGIPNALFRGNRGRLSICCSEDRSLAQNRPFPRSCKAVVIFSFEYMIRFIGSGVDPEFAFEGDSSILCPPQIKYLLSFYSIVDLLAIVPFYLSIAFPGSWFDEHDEYL